MPAIAEINALDEAAFVALLGGIFEHSPWVAAGAFHARPFHDTAALHAEMSAVVDAAGEAMQEALIKAHPDLAGKLARAGNLTGESKGEQGGLGLDRLSDADFERFDRLNTEYRTRFGFPFIIAARENTRASVMAAFERRLGHDRAAEFATALAEIKKIARFRLADLCA